MGDFHRIYATSRHIPGVKFTGHPGRIGCEPSRRRTLIRWCHATAWVRGDRLCRDLWILRREEDGKAWGMSRVLAFVLVGAPRDYRPLARRVDALSDYAGWVEPIGGIGALVKVWGMSERLGEIAEQILRTVNGWFFPAGVMERWEGR